ncbi:MAG: DUF3108 domain-containing protein [Acidobacteriota bacterium]
MKRKRAVKIITGIIIAVLIIALFPFSDVTVSQAGEFTESSFEFQAPAGAFVKGEELLYEVSYSMFDLGTVKAVIIDSYQRNGKTCYKAKAYIDSYSGVPFVSLHAVFFTDMLPTAFSNYFSAYDTKKPEEMKYVKYSFDYQKKLATYERGISPQGTITKSGTAPVNNGIVDGLSLFYYARVNVHQRKEVNVPTFVDEAEVNTYFDFKNEKEAKEIDAVKYPVQTVHFEGHSDYVGFFGMTGGFEGYFSDDEAAVPIVAKMKVVIGSVHIELIKWNRPGWTPPKAPSKS